MCCLFLKDLEIRQLYLVDIVVYVINVEKNLYQENLHVLFVHVQLKELYRL